MSVQLLLLVLLLRSLYFLVIVAEFVRVRAGVNSDHRLPIT